MKSRMGITYFANKTDLKHDLDRKAELSQRWPRDAPYIWVPWKFLGVPDYVHGYFSRNFLWIFVPIDPMHVRTKFEVSSFRPTRSWDNMGYPKNLRSPWIRPRSLFSKIFTGRFFLFGWTLWMYVPAKSEVRIFTRSLDNRDWSFGWGLQTPTLGEEKAIGGRRWYRLKERWWVPIGPP